MRDLTQGRAFHGEFTSADASALSEANSRITLYSIENAGTITLASNERVVITDIFVLAGAALTVTLYDGGDNSVAAGERILLGNFAANGGLNGPLATPHYCQRGPTNGYPKVKTSGAGQVDVTIRGVIERMGQ